MASINAIREKHAGVNPGRVLNTATYVGLNTSDVLLMPQGESNLTEALEDWYNFLEGDITYMERAVAEKSLSEIALIGYAFDQIEGEVDCSDDIRKNQEQMFGYYDSDLYHGALLQRIRELDAIETVDDKVLKAYVTDRFESLLPQNEILAGLEKPKPETLAHIGAWLKDQFADLLSEIDEFESNNLNSADIANFFDKCIRSTPSLAKTGWRVEVIERQKLAISVYASERVIIIPLARTISKSALKGIMIHEVFGHALRSANAEQSGDAIGTIGTATYSSFEESFEIALEQCLKGEYDPQRGVDHYVAIGMAVTSNLSKDEIAKLSEAVYYLRLSSDKKSADDRKKIANEKASTQIKRTFAGMTDVDDGIAYMKDIDYLHGLNNSWRLLNFIVSQGIVDTAMPWLLSSKFNPFDEHERAHASKYIPMPSLLEDFFIAHQL